MTQLKPFAWLFGVLFALLAHCPSAAYALEVPPLEAHVNDRAGMLTAPERAQLEQQLTDYEHKTGRQFALLTLDSLDGDALESFSMRVVEAWKLGKKGKDDGLLLLVVNNDRKLRVEVGYGLEGSVTDAFSARVIRNVLVPAMRAGQTAAGLKQGFELLMREAAGEDVSNQALKGPDAEPDSEDWNLPVWFRLLFVLVPFAIPFLLLHRGPRNGGGGGGGGGGFGGFGGGGGGGSGGGGWGGGGGFSGGGGGFGGGGASGSW